MIKITDQMKIEETNVSLVSVFNFSSIYLFTFSISYCRRFYL